MVGETLLLMINYFPKNHDGLACQEVKSTQNRINRIRNHKNKNRVMKEAVITLFFNYF